RAAGRPVFPERPPGVDCRPSCRATRALRKTGRGYANAQQALDAGFRPCKRCQPDNARAQLRRGEKIACACRVVETAPPLALASLAP
ncbi:bifunctional transcriptional activator/DNA repair enzyme protein Ada, partial [Salmonella enterica subsp. enterica serovar Wilhelmsburg]